VDKGCRCGKMGKCGQRGRDLLSAISYLGVT
jgi:hypothetical protein